MHGRELAKAGAIPFNNTPARKAQVWVMWGDATTIQEQIYKLLRWKVWRWMEKLTCGVWQGQQCLSERDEAGSFGDPAMALCVPGQIWDDACYW